MYLSDTICFLISFTLFFDKATENLYIPKGEIARKCQNKAVFTWNLAIYEIFCSYEFSSSMCVLVLKPDFVSSDVWTDIFKKRGQHFINKYRFDHSKTKANWVWNWLNA